MERDGRSDNPASGSLREELRGYKADPSPKARHRLFEAFRRMFDLRKWGLGYHRVWGSDDEKEVLALLEELDRRLKKYAERSASENVTRKAVSAAAKRVEKMFRSEAQYKRREALSGDTRELQRPLAVRPNYIDDVVDFYRQCLSQGVIDAVEFYFLVAKHRGFQVKKAAEQLKMSPSTARTILDRAAEYIERGLEKSKRGRPRQAVDEELLVESIHYVLNS
jgi:hypothetical protein